MADALKTFEYLRSAKVNLQINVAGQNILVVNYLGRHRVLFNFTRFVLLVNIKLKIQNYV